ncbi:NADPH-dependent FMN reductase [Nitratireductor basaltis]|uniref:NADPH-dependent FMN reductase n=1 Tax=Nitratireductor basaltis TaxID=472175 RepID=A0A084U667_9HYPH|nr:NAD(P)H-dependent oxidoreductase [Nitratireductor basaltis]KFB08453.1 NADPH-dependent FMN reductase [Nitratireductor basaltis]
MTVSILVFAGSVRGQALSGKTADAATRELALQGAEVTRISLADYPLPIFDQDLERDKGVPQNAVKLASLVASHDGFLIATPEYNASLPPLLKNAIDWISRVKQDGSGRTIRAFAGKSGAICSSSNGVFAGIRAANHLRAVLVHCQAEVVSAQCSVGRAQEAFDEAGNLRDEATQKKLATTCRALLEAASISRQRRN